MLGFEWCHHSTGEVAHKDEGNRPKAGGQRRDQRVEKNEDRGVHVAHKLIPVSTTIIPMATMAVSATAVWRIS